MTLYDVHNRYFEWLSDLVCGDRFSSRISYRKLLMHLHRTEFRYLIQRDQNRAKDGVGMRYRFALDNGYERDTDAIMDILDGPCSVLEMIVGLTIRCEETIMDDPTMGDRTSQWFWGMISNLGLGAMSDDRFDKRLATDIIDDFLDRRYEPNGRGGLFTIRNCDEDLRKVEIWYQLCWYLDSIT